MKKMKCLKGVKRTLHKQVNERARDWIERARGFSKICPFSSLPEGEKPAGEGSKRTAGGRTGETFIARGLLGLDFVRK